MTKKLVKTLLVALAFVFVASNNVYASQSPQENAKKLIVQTAKRIKAITLFIIKPHHELYHKIVRK